MLHSSVSECLKHYIKIQTWGNKMETNDAITKY